VLYGKHTWMERAYLRQHNLWFSRNQFINQIHYSCYGG